jgi:hypothetical protein
MVMVKGAKYMMSAGDEAGSIGGSRLTGRPGGGGVELGLQLQQLGFVLVQVGVAVLRVPLQRHARVKEPVGACKPAVGVVRRSASATSTT